MKTSEHFKLARKSIEKGENTFICCALIETTPESMSPPVRARDVIYTRMGSISVAYSLERWLYDNGHIEDIRQPTREQMREYRLAWLDSLIEEFECQGD